MIFKHTYSRRVRLSTRLPYLYIVAVCCSKLAFLLPDKWFCCLPQVGSHGNRRRPVSHQLEIWIPSFGWMLVHQDPHTAPSRILHTARETDGIVEGLGDMFRHCGNVVELEKTKCKIEVRKTSEKSWDCNILDLQLKVWFPQLILFFNHHHKKQKQQSDQLF